MIKERNIAVSIILAIVTCGIYGIYWIACVADESNAASGEKGPSGVALVLLTLVTCGIYFFVWAYTQGARLDAAKAKRGMPGTDSAIAYLLLSIFSLSIVAIALMQNELNKMARS